MFYFIRSSLSEKYKYVYKDASFKSIKQSDCTHCGRKVLSFLYDDSKKHQLVLDGGRIFPDFLAYCGAGYPLVLFSERLINILANNCITGIKDCEPVCLFTETTTGFELNSNSPLYYIVKFDGLIDYDYTAMFLKKKNKCNSCNQYELNRKRLYPSYIDTSTWSGNDIGYLYTFPTMIVCTKKVKDLISHNKLIGVEFEPIKTVDDSKPLKKIDE